jgi:hypothetical protein
LSTISAAIASSNENPSHRLETRFMCRWWI